MDIWLNLLPVFQVTELLHYFYAMHAQLLQRLTFQATALVFI